MQEVLQSIWTTITELSGLDFAGMIFGLLCVWFLIKENIWTWPMGIAYVLIAFVIFYNAKLYADFALHVFFLIMNIYGWYYWLNGRKAKETEVPVTTTNSGLLISVLGISIVGIFLVGYLLQYYTDASLPYWDSTTSVLSLSAMWLTAKKKIESWGLWLIVDIVATGVYIYKDIYFFALLYFIYIAMAISGYISWKKSMTQKAVPA